MCPMQKRQRSPESESGPYDTVQRPEELIVLGNDNRIQLVIQLVLLTACLLYQCVFQSQSAKKQKLPLVCRKKTQYCKLETKHGKNFKENEYLKSLLNFRRTLPQSTFALPVSLETYFESLSSGNSLSLDETMSNNLLRLSSYSNFPATVNIFSSQLAKAGFYYKGNSDEVRCYACGVTYKNWEKHDNPMNIHKRLSPSCSHVINIPPLNDEEGVVSSSSSVSNYNRNQPVSSATSNSLTSPTNASLPVNASHAMDNSVSGVHASSNVSDSATTLQPPLLPLSVGTHNATSSQLDCSNSNDIGVATTNSSSSHVENQTASSSTLSSMGINIDKPKYPNYAQLQARISSFQGWPSYLDQTPRDMATAGFLFAGYNDYTRCFFCGGGLRNWEAGDDPWVEHARWFPKCAYLRQNKGDLFINAVQKKQQQLLLPTETMAPLNSSSRGQTNSHLDTVAARSVLEMGYSEDQVLDAIRQFTSRSDNTELSAAAILSTLFHDDRNNDPMAASRSAINSGAADMESNNVKNTGLTGNGINDLTLALDDSKLDDTETVLEENRQLKDQRLCKICLDLEASITFLPCGHLVCCVDCAPAMRKCPMCRVFVKGTVKTFLI